MISAEGERDRETEEAQENVLSTVSLDLCVVTKRMALIEAD